MDPTFRLLSQTMRIPILPLLFLLIAGGLGRDAYSQTSKITNFARDIAPLLRDNCLSCHEGAEASNGFLISDRNALLGFIEPGNAAASSLWTDYLTQPPTTELKDSLVMPPNGPLKPALLATLKLWIDEGADWPEGVPLLGEAKAAPSDKSVSVGIRAFRAIGYFHPALVHFPIALFLVGGGCAFLSYFLGSKCQTTAFQCVSLAAMTSIITVVMGWSFADTQGYAAWSTPLAADASHRDANLFYHRWVGTLTAVLGVACVFMGLIARRNKSDRLNHAWRIVAMLLALLVSVVGHQGGELVYGDVFEKAWQEMGR